MSDGDSEAKKKKRQYVMASVLILIFVALVAKGMLPKKKAAVSSAAAVESGQNLPDRVVFITDLRINDKLREEQEKVWSKEWERDPFVPQAVSAIVRAVNLTLKGILWDETKPRAIVNEKTLLIGDTIYGYTVVDIKQRSVILKTGEKSIELKVFRPIVTETQQNRLS